MADAAPAADVQMEDATSISPPPAAPATENGTAAAAASTPADPSSAGDDASSSLKKKLPGKGKPKKEDPVEVDPNFPGQKYHIGETIYANYAEGKQWFEAKVLKVEKRQELIYYYLHYQKWSDKFNDWRPYHKDSELMKYDDEGKKIYEAARIAMKEGKAGKGKGAATTAAADTDAGKKKKRKHDDDDPVDDDVQVGGASGEVKLKISGFLKKQLIADWESVTRQHRLVTLPRPTTVHALLQEFEQSKAKQESSHNMCKEIVNGLEQYFEKALGTVLLYRFERPQFKAQVEQLKGAVAPAPTTLSQIYGAEHLLRLFGTSPIEQRNSLVSLRVRASVLTRWSSFCVVFVPGLVKLPSLLAYTKLEIKEAVVLGSKLNEFIQFLHKKAQGGQLFQAEYEATDKDYAQAVTNETE